MCISVFAHSKWPRLAIQEVMHIVPAISSGLERQKCARRISKALFNVMNYNTGGFSPLLCTIPPQSNKITDGGNEANGV